MRLQVVKSTFLEEPGANNNSWILHLQDDEGPRHASRALPDELKRRHARREHPCLHLQLIPRPGGCPLEHGFSALKISKTGKDTMVGRYLA